MRFRHPTIDTGTITHEGQAYPIANGVVEVPEALGQFLRLTPAPEATPVKPVAPKKAGWIAKP